MNFDFGRRMRPCAGETASGDLSVVRQTPSHTLFGVIDALGHGAGAAEVAHAAGDHLGEIALDGGITSIVESLHRHLRGSRGAAAMLCVVAADGELQACGVGNVELRTDAALPVVLSPGILGGTVRKFRTFGGRIAAGTRLVLFSDGISGRFSSSDHRALTPLKAANELLRRFGYAHDDATVLVADAVESDRE